VLSVLLAPESLWPGLPGAGDPGLSGSRKGSLLVEPGELLGSRNGLLPGPEGDDGDSGSLNGSLGFGFGSARFSSFSTEFGPSE
jgi:hypothetical protein